VNIDIVDRAPAHVAYLRYTGPFGEPLGRFWRGTVAQWLAYHGLIDCPRYGVAVDSPPETAPDATRYDCCVELTPGLELPDAAQATIPGGRIAVTRFKGTSAAIGAAWDGFARECDARGLVLDRSRAPFEHYPRGAPFDARTGSFVCELCLPVSEARPRIDRNTEL
jgi:AraC family transcriptional regulator